MPENKIIRVKTISEAHRMAGLPMPEHPLMSILKCGDLKDGPSGVSIVLDFYMISLKRGCDKLMYGQNKYDFDDGVMGFIAPNQVVQGRGNPDEVNLSGWMLLIHPDFFWNTALAKKINQYEYFSYAVNEALFLSEKEEGILNEIVEHIKHEYHSNIDNFSQNIIVAHLDAMFSYAERFYNRQFITRKKTNHKILERLEQILSDYFNDGDLATKGLPTVQFVSDALNVSPGYLSGLLKVLTGESTQQHIQNKVIEKAKERLSTTDLTINEIAYELGFEYPQSFSKLFKKKTDQSPMEFRASFN